MHGTEQLRETNPRESAPPGKTDPGKTRLPWWIRKKPYRHWLKGALNGWFQLRDRLALGFLRATGRNTVMAWHNKNAVAGSRFVVFATYPAGSQPPCHYRLLKAFEERGYCIIIVTNLADAVPARLGYDAHWPVLQRRPFGRDFGCYQDGMRAILDLAESGVAIERVVLLNDSFVTFPNSEGAIVSHLDDLASDFSGLSENFEIGYHVGSFALAVGKRVVSHPAFVDFWRKYVPVSSRYHSISAGEMGLSKTLREAGFLPSVLHDLPSAKAKLALLDLPGIRRLCRRLPARFDREHTTLLQAVDQFLDTREIGECVARSDDLRDRLVHEILAFVFRASPVHLGAVLAAQGPGALIKKDVVWRQATNPWDLRDMIRAADPGASTAEQDAIYSAIMARGHPYTLGTWRRALYEWSII